MLVLFRGGAYDGTRIDRDLLERRCRMIPVLSQMERRNFVLMPPREDWERVAAGEQAPGDRLYPYERVDLARGGFEFHAAPPDAVEMAVRESQLKLDAEARFVLDLRNLDEQRRVLRVLATLQALEPAQWPADQVERLNGDPNAFLIRVPPDLRAYVTLSPAGEIELRDVIREETYQWHRVHAQPAGERP